MGFTEFTQVGDSPNHGFGPTPINSDISGVFVTICLTDIVCTKIYCYPSMKIIEWRPSCKLQYMPPKQINSILHPLCLDTGVFVTQFPLECFHEVALLCVNKM